MMQIWILLIWVIAALMACWSFSLLLRWISETIARKRTHLQAKRSRRSTWLGFVLIFICAGVSVFAGWMAIYLESLYTSSNNPWATPPAIISGTIIIFAIFLTIWAIIGDRARGRTRCPKCWYDMSAAINLQCPECGHEVNNPAGFSRSRRPKWAFVVAVLLLIVGSLGIGVSRDVAEYGPLGVVPTWALMMGWEILPNDWIGVDSDTSIDGCLRERLSDNRISRSRMRRFGNRLCAPLIDDRDARTDPKRIILLRKVNFEITSILDKSTDTYVWADPPVDIEALLRLTMIDAIEALTAENPTPAQNATIAVYANATFIAADWLFERESSTGRLGEDVSYFSPEFYALTAEVIGEMPPVLHTELFGRNLIHRDFRRLNLSWPVANLTGVYREHMGIYFNTSPDPNLTTIRMRATAMMRMYNILPYEEQVPILRRLVEWMKSHDVAQRAFAIHAAEKIGSLDFYYNIFGADNLGRHPYSSNQETNEAFGLLKKTMITHAINDDRVAYPNKVRSQTSIHFETLKALNAISPGEAKVYRLFRESLLAGFDTPETYVDYLPDAMIPQAAKNWMEQFGDLQDHQSPYVREWFTDNLPESNAPLP